MLAASDRADTTNSAVESCEDSTANCDEVTNVGTAIVNIIHRASVWARCCSQAPFLMKKAGMVQEISRAAPA